MLDNQPYGTSGKIGTKSAGLPSRGSKRHGKNNANDGKPACRPCAWFWKSTGCPRNLNCKYCHLCPAGEVEKRKKEKIDKLKADFDQWKKAQYDEANLEPKRVGNQATRASEMASGKTSTQNSDITGFPSRGSKNHGKIHEDNGRPKCKPCVWFWKPSGCSRGWACNYCHMCPEVEVRERKKLKQLELSAKVRQWRGLQCNSRNDALVIGIRSLHGTKDPDVLKLYEDCASPSDRSNDDASGRGSSSGSSYEHDELFTELLQKSGLQICIKNTFLDILGATEAWRLRRVKSAPELRANLIDADDHHRRHLRISTFSSSDIIKARVSDKNADLDSEFDDTSSANSPIAAMAKSLSVI